MHGSCPVELPDWQIHRRFVVLPTVKVFPLNVPGMAVIFWNFFIARAENLSRACRLLPSRDTAGLVGLNQQNFPNPVGDRIEVAAVTAASTIRSHRNEPGEHFMQGATGSKANYVLLGGDSTVEVWERIYEDFLDDDPDALAWHILLALHHCSRRSIGRVENPNTKDEEFIPSSKAEAALGNKQGDGFVVSSSNRIVRGGKTPPSYHAKNRYLKILADGGQVTDKQRERFLCTGGNAEGDKPEHVEFKFSTSGPSKAALATTFFVTTGASSGRGGGYG